MAKINDPGSPRITPLLGTGARRSWFATLSLLGLLATTGCSGCFETPQGAETAEERRERLAKEPLADFEKPNLNVLPSDDRRTQLNRVKPGHWANVSTQLKANNFDFRGELFAYTVDSQNNPVAISDTDYFLTTTRPIALPKGQERWSDVLFFPPQFEGSSSQNRLFACDLRPVGGGRPVLVERLATTRMQPQEYYMVVLASSSDEYQFLEATDVLRPLHGLVSPEESAPHYRLVLPKTIDRVAVPENSMAWTAIAYLLWDGIDPELLSLDQQQAMLDWLHFGGQLIISGPDSLNQLKLSFLADYLPAEDVGSIELTQDDFQVWNDEFVTTERLYESNRWVEREFNIDLRAGALRGSQLKLRPEGQFIPKTGDLVAERRVGRGRIAVTAFQIRSPDISRNWKNFDTFLNAVLLRRPPREFRVDQNETIVSGWKGSYAFNDPRLVTSLRFLSRDLVNQLALYRRWDAGQAPTTVVSQQSPDPAPFAETANQEKPVEPRDVRDDLPADQSITEFGGFGFDSQSGVAGWSDRSGVSAAARQCLREAAGITIPNGNFVLRVTAGYLLILVPLNWFVFWLIGRVEWAWIAAPVIAVIGAAFVIKLAELDIGFARSRTEIAFLETHAGYHRAHLTRYTSLYTSLSTSYDLDFSESTSVALPFGRSADSQSNQSRRFSGGPSEVHYHQEGGDTLLSGLQVASNSSTMVHSEYFLSPSGDPIFQWTPGTEQGGALFYSAPQTLHDVGILRRLENGTIEIAWIGDLAANTEHTIEFRAAENDWELFSQWNSSPVLAVGTSGREVNLRHMLNVVKDTRQLQPGETRLLGWTEEDMPGLVISPVASQYTIRTMVVAHLQHATLPPPERDANTRRFKGQEPDQMQSMQLDAIEGL